MFTYCALTIIRDSFSKDESKRSTYERVISFYTGGLHANETQVDTTCVSVEDFNKMQDECYEHAYDEYYSSIMAHSKKIGLVLKLISRSNI